MGIYRENALRLYSGLATKDQLYGASCYLRGLNLRSMSKNIRVSSEVGTLQRLIIHSPDAGIGKIAPRMMQDLLYDDIVYLDNMRKEYNQYLSVLLWFLDPEVMRNRDKNDPDFFKPTKPG